MHSVDVAGIRNTQHEVRKARVVRHELHVFMRLDDGLQFRTAEYVLYARDGPEKRVHSPRQDKFRAGALGTKIILEPAFLFFIDACCDLRHDAPGKRLYFYVLSG